MKHHSHEELDEKIHAFLASKTDKQLDWGITAVDVNDAEEVRDRRFNMFSPFIPLDTQSYK